LGAEFERAPAGLRSAGRSGAQGAFSFGYFSYVAICQLCLLIFEITFFVADKKPLPFLIRALMRQVPIRYQKKVRHFFAATFVAKSSSRYFFKDLF
jgi:hypothetical protein